MYVTDNDKKSVLERAKEVRYSSVKTQAVFDIRTSHPDLFEALKTEIPGVARTLNELGDQLPLPRESLPKIDGAFYRLPQHNRSFCYALAGDNSKSLFDSDVIVFKGMEPLIDDYGRYFDWMCTSPFRASSLPMAHHFPLVEGKAPGVTGAAEALAEARVSIELQQKHLRHYGHLAKLPLPLLVHSIDQKRTEQLLSLFERKLPDLVYRKIAQNVRSGLAILVYYYPSAPLRADFTDSDSRKYVLNHRSRFPDRDYAIQGWITLFARFLHLGYMPATAWSNELGTCLDFGNAVLDGGLCDLDSVVPFGVLPDDVYFYDSLSTSLEILRETIVTTLQLSSATRGPKSMIRMYLLNQVRRALETEKKPGLEIDPRVHFFLNNDDLPQMVAAFANNTLIKRPYGSG